MYGCDNYGNCNTNEKNNKKRYKNNTGMFNMSSIKHIDSIYIKVLNRYALNIKIISK